MRIAQNAVHLMLAIFVAVLLIAFSPVGLSEASGPDSLVLEQTGPVGEVIPGMVDGQRLLTWVAPGNRPGNQAAGTPGELVYFNPDGSTESILTLPQGTTRVTECGPNGTSPDGKSVV